MIWGCNVEQRYEVQECDAEPAHKSFSAQAANEVI